MTWFVSWKFDGFFFFLPYVATWLLILSLPQEVLTSVDYFSYGPIIVWALINIGLVSGHIWSTLYRTYLDEDTRKNYDKFFLFGVPAFCFVLLFVLTLWSIEFVLLFLFYSAIYHALKQFFGVSALYSARFSYLEGPLNTEQKELIAKQRKWDRIVIGNVFWLCAIYWHFSIPAEVGLFHFPKEDFVLWLLPASVLELSSIDQVLSGFYIAFHLLMLAPLSYWIWLYTRPILRFQTVKVCWLLANVSTLYFVLTFFSGTFLVIIPLHAIHAIEYYGINGFYQYQKKKEQGVALGSFFAKAGTLVIGLAAVNIMLIEVFSLGDRSEIASFFELGWSNSGVGIALAVAVVFTADVAHYLFDAYLWRFNGKNPKLFNYLIKQ